MVAGSIQDGCRFNTKWLVTLLLRLMFSGSQVNDATHKRTKPGIWLSWLLQNTECSYIMLLRLMFSGSRVNNDIIFRAGCHP